jgi:hypothetical protein
VDEQLQLLERQLRDFRNDPTALVIEYPATLSNKQRQRLHVVAEKLNLQHVSHGEEGNRVLVVSKPTTTRPKSAAASTPTTPAPAMVPDSNGYMRQEDSGYQRAKRVNAYVYRTTRPPRLTNSTHMRTYTYIHTYTHAHMRTYIHTLIFASGIGFAELPRFDPFENLLDLMEVVALVRTIKLRAQYKCHN